MVDDLSKEIADVFFPLKTDMPNDGWNACYRQWITAHLIAMGESPLYASEATSADVYRFLSLEKPSSVVTIHIDDEIAFAVCKRIDTITDNGRAFTFVEQRLDLTKYDRQTLLMNVELSGFWSLSIDGEPHGLDGLRFVVEAKVGDRYNVVDRWCPTRDPFAKLCQMFLNMQDRAWTRKSKSRWWLRLLPTGAVRA